VPCWLSTWEATPRDTLAASQRVASERNANGDPAILSRRPSLEVSGPALRHVSRRALLNAISRARNCKPRQAYSYQKKAPWGPGIRSQGGGCHASSQQQPTDSRTAGGRQSYVSAPCCVCLCRRRRFTTRCNLTPVVVYSAGKQTHTRSDAGTQSLRSREIFQLEIAGLPAVSANATTVVTSGVMPVRRNPR
jgi:hypothetical protein